MNQINEQINTEEIKKQSRSFDPKEVLQILSANKPVFWSWGAHAFTIDNPKDTRMFRMKVNGHYHKGHVYIFLNGADLFDVYLTNKDGKIVQKTPEMGLFFDQLVDWIDEKIEKISAYNR